MLLLWAARDGAIQYQAGNATILYVSDVGATVAVIFFLLTITFDRQLRRTGFLPPPLRKREWWFGTMSIFFAIAGSTCLILLTIFDDVNYDRAHWGLTLCFMVFIALSAVAGALEVWWLRKDYERMARPRKHLKSSQKIKLWVVAGAIVLTVAMGILMGSCEGGGSECSPTRSAAAVCEWLIAFPFVAAYFASFLADSWPAVTSVKRSRRLADQGHHGVMVENGRVPGYILDRTLAQTRRGPGGVVGMKNGRVVGVSTEEGNLNGSAYGGQNAASSA
ncbi:hypothetical protein HDU93_003395 [Gonapodya sp. JEL0774]|nr:hypothetical protein HDU93_003395 [Gonapodya sp. JEL0774]